MVQFLVKSMQNDFVHPSSKSMWNYIAGNTHLFVMPLHIFDLSFLANLSYLLKFIRRACAAALSALGGMPSQGTHWGLSAYPDLSIREPCVSQALLSWAAASGHFTLLLYPLTVWSLYWGLKRMRESLSCFGAYRWHIVLSYYQP